MTACASAGGGLGPEAPENRPPAPSPAGCFTPPEPTAWPAISSTGCRCNRTWSVHAVSFNELLLYPANAWCCANNGVVPVQWLLYGHGLTTLNFMDLRWLAHYYVAV